MYDGEPQRGADGARHEIDATTRVSAEEGMVLYSLCLVESVSATLDVGLAYGFSTVFMLAAQDRIGRGSHVAVDPFQMTDWHGIGLTHANDLVSRSTGPTSRFFAWIEDFSHRALVDLERAGRTFGLVFIDGYHRFDDVLIDFTLSARLCRAGGIIVLHDLWLNSIKAVVSFVEHNRPDFTRVETGCENLGVFRRTGEDLRDWTHFVDFPLR
jgi:hypothetical protein